MNSNELIKTKSYPPGPKSYKPLGALPALLKDPIGQFTSMFNQYGDFIYFKKGLSYRYLLTNPEGVHRVLVENQNNYRKSPRYQKLALALGDGLLTTDGKFWAEQRKKVQTFFRPQTLLSYESIMKENIEAKFDKWRKSIFKNGYIEFTLYEEMISLTMSIATQCFFGFDNSKNSSEQISNYINNAVHEINDMMESMIQTPNWIPTIKKSRLVKNLKPLQSLVESIILTRYSNLQLDQSKLENQNRSQLGLLWYLLNENFPPKLVRDHVMTFFISGHETTATALTWTLYLLLQNPEFLNENVFLELGYEAILNESMRLYPPIWIFSRQALDDDEILGYPISAGSTLNICPFLTHRHPDYWDKPLKFNPYRFQEGANYPKGSFYPFALGSRQCIGAHFAIKVASLFLKSFFNEFKIQLISPINETVSLNPRVILKPGHQIMVRIQFKKG